MGRVKELLEDHPEDTADFSYEYVGGKEANDQYGSGFYFFTNEKYMFEYIGNNDYKQWNKLFKKIIYKKALN